MLAGSSIATQWGRNALPLAGPRPAPAAAAAARQSCQSRGYEAARTGAKDTPKKALEH